MRKYIPSDEVRNTVTQALIEMRLETMAVFFRKRPVTLEDFINYMKPPDRSAPNMVKSDLDGLSLPQLIVLYGKLTEKDMLPKHIQEVEELLK